ncbi:DUF2513 domain-containing protein [Sphingomonas sp. 10B4]|uniref:DUF2513 domain-containing protein n=1 Tax=Sphingomonas sp. 10B4 TaxID=3048575 RepID=UPI002AB5BDB5|nr:DUF2513 domain-containing protein [Sphingomonas sp. 10B4]MDY7526216.1 DUF2513 domain-containing protein [Sphingomonas sp. 10B4]
MKRDMELIREIMLQLEVWPMEMGDAISMTPEAMQAEIPDRDLAEINHHMDLIRSAGFIDTGGLGHPDRCSDSYLWASPCQGTTSLIA